MKTDGLFIVHEKTIPAKSGVPFHIVFFGDVHRDSPNHADEAWQTFLTHARSIRDKSWFFGMGDYLDATSTSERNALQRIDSEMHENVKKTLDEIMLERTEAFSQEIQFMKGRTIGLLNGNHYFRWSTGINSDQKLCELLKTTYLGVSSFVRLYIKCGKQDIRGHSTSLDIWAHHGTGAGRLLGSSITRVDQMREHAESDIYCVDEQTEILTSTGWRKRPDVNVGDVVVGFDRDTGQSKWVPVQEKMQFEYRGPAIRMKNSNVDSLVHPKHRVVYRYGTTKGWLVREAQDFLNMTGQIVMPLAATTCYNEDPDLVTLEEARLCGWLVSEGSFGHPSGVQLTQKYPPKCQLIREAIRSCGMPFSEWKRADGCTQFYIKRESRSRILEMLPTKKDIPSWLMECGQRNFEAFLETLILGDGHAQTPTSGSIYSARESFVDDLQAACVVHGYRTHKSFKPGGFKDGGWVLTYCKHPTSDLALNRSLVTQELYSGTMWCVTTDTGTFVARRGGKTFVTGNCMGHDHKRGVVPANPRLFLDRNRVGELKVKSRQQWLVRSGSFLKSYVHGERCYNVDAGRGPCSLGHVELIVTPTLSHGMCYLQIQGLA